MCEGQSVPLYISYPKLFDGFRPNSLFAFCTKVCDRSAWRSRHIRPLSSGLHGVVCQKTVSLTNFGFWEGIKASGTLSASLAQEYINLRCHCANILCHEAEDDFSFTAALIFVGHQCVTCFLSLVLDFGKFVCPSFSQLFSPEKITCRQFELLSVCLLVHLIAVFEPADWFLRNVGWIYSALLNFTTS